MERNAKILMKMENLFQLSTLRGYSNVIIFAKDSQEQRKLVKIGQMKLSAITSVQEKF